MNFTQGAAYFKKLGLNTDKALIKAVTDSAKLIEGQAKKNFPRRHAPHKPRFPTALPNRITSKLLTSTMAIPAKKVSDGVEGHVISTAEYAAHLEKMYPYMAPAIKMTSHAVKTTISTALARALK